MNQQLTDIINQTIDEHLDGLLGIRTYLYENPEIGGEDKKSSAYLIQYLKKIGFEVEENFHHIPYAFKAVVDSGKLGPSIGITAEYDALPGIGHGCGHNVIAATSVGAAIGLKSIINQTGGRVVLFGTPAEENLCSKTQLTEEGAFEEVDVVMTMHPNPIGIASGSSTAVDAWQIEFYGKSSHAGMEPEKGINALDAAVHFYSLIGFEKQYLKNTNIYGVFVDGGQKCSVIPEHASVKYLIRTENMEAMGSVRAMFERCAKAAAGAIGASYKIWQNEPANKNLITNEALSERFNINYEAVSGERLPKLDVKASTDMGDVSHVVPVIHPWLGMDCPNCQLHSEEFARETMSSGAEKVIINGAKAIALTGADVLTDPDLLANIKKEFAKITK